MQPQMMSSNGEGRGVAKQSEGISHNNVLAGHVQFAIGEI